MLATCRTIRTGSYKVLVQFTINVMSLGLIYSEYYQTVNVCQNRQELLYLGVISRYVTGIVYTHTGTHPAGGLCTPPVPCSVLDINRVKSRIHLSPVAGLQKLVSF
jgi:hypothetical protein